MKKTITALSIVTLLLTACAKPTRNASENIQTTAQTQAAANYEAATPTIDSEHNAQTSLDWAGEYIGLLPCADCSGIQTKLVLNQDNTYELTEQYQDKGDDKAFKSQGIFSFDTSGSIITLDQNAENRKFFVGENFIEAREFETGAKIDGQLADHYQLHKELK